jgi:flagellar biosynthetic protein FlhB
MAEQDDGSKTEDPTQKRLDDAREKGNVIRSVDVGNLILLGGGSAALLLLSPWIMSDLALTTRRFIELPHDLRLDTGSMQRALADLATDVALVLFLPFLIFVLLAVATSILQFGFLLTTESITPKLERISPLAGFKRLFSLRSIVELVKGVIKISVVGTVAFLILWPLMRYADQFAQVDVAAILPMLYDEIAILLSGVIAVLVLIAAADYFYQRFDYMKNMRMTKQELKDEFKDAEGDPHIKAKLRQLRQDRTRKRMMQNVPTATVVVTNPTHYAVALRYEEKMAAPVVVAKGTDLIAKRIRDIARENFVPVVENPPLARTLFQLVEIDDEVPEEQYKAVAEVIGYVMRMKRQAAH